MAWGAALVSCRRRRLATTTTTTSSLLSMEEEQEMCSYGIGAMYQSGNASRSRILPAWPIVCRKQHSREDRKPSSDSAGFGAFTLPRIHVIAFLSSLVVS